MPSKPSKPLAIPPELDAEGTPAVRGFVLALLQRKQGGRLKGDDLVSSEDETFAGSNSGVINVDGVLAPGTSAGQLSLQARNNGSINFSDSTSFEMEINDFSAGQFDQLDLSANRRQKSPAVVGSGIRSAPRASRNASSLRRNSMSSSRTPSHNAL